MSSNEATTRSKRAPSENVQSPGRHSSAKQSLTYTSFDEYLSSKVEELPAHLKPPDDDKANFLKELAAAMVRTTLQDKERIILDMVQSWRENHDLESEGKKTKGLAAKIHGDFLFEHQPTEIDDGRIRFNDFEDDCAFLSSWWLKHSETFRTHQLCEEFACGIKPTGDRPSYVYHALTDLQIDLQGGQ